LVGYTGKALKASGMRIDTDLVTGISVPILALVVWVGLNRLRKRFK
jgi:uncharacterized membrane-anchored protein